MYCDFFGLRCRPFQDRADTQFCFAFADWEEAVAGTLYQVRHGRGMAVVWGEAGTGKTLLIRNLLQRLHASDHVVVLPWPPTPGTDLIREVCKGFGVTLPESEHHIRCYTRLRRHLVRTAVKGHRSILIVDRAENLNTDNLTRLATLSELRHGGANLLNIALVGQPQLRSLLEGPEHARISEWLSGERSLRPLTPAQTRDYVQHRLRVAGGGDAHLFTDEAVALIHQASKGVPGRINRMADAAMLAAYGAGESRVTGAIAAEAMGAKQPVHRTARASDLGVSTPEQVAAGLTRERKAQMRPEQVTVRQTTEGLDPAVAGPADTVAPATGGGDEHRTPSACQLADATEGFPPVSDDASANSIGNVEPDEAFPMPGDTILSAAETQLHQLERTIDRAERINATTDASLAKYTAVEKHLISLAGSAEGLVGNLATEVQNAGASLDNLQQRADQLSGEAQARLEGIETQASEASELSNDIEAQRHRVEQACERADRIESRLRSFAEGIADKADELQDRITLLMTGLEAGEEARERADALLGQVSAVTASADEKVDELRATLGEATARTEQFNPEFIDTAIAHCKDRVEQALEEVELSQLETVEATQDKLDGIAQQASSITTSTAESVNDLRNALDNAKREAERVRAEFTRTALDRLREELQEQVEAHMRTQHEAMEAALSEHDAKLQTMREALDEQLEAKTRTHQDTMERHIATHQATLGEMVADWKSQIANLEERIAGCRRNADETISTLEERIEGTRRNADEMISALEERIQGSRRSGDEMISTLEERIEGSRRNADETISACQRYQTEINASFNATADELRQHIERLERREDHVESSVQALADDLQGAETRTSELTGTVRDAEASVGRLTEQAAAATGDLTPSIQRAETLLRDVQSGWGEIGAMQRGVATILVEIGGAHERVDAIRGQAARCEELTERFTRGQTEGERIVKELDEATASSVQASKGLNELLESANGTKDSMHGIVADAATQRDRLDSQSNLATCVLGDLNQANEACQVLMERADESAQGVSRAVDEAKEQIDRLTAVRTSTQDTTEELNELVGTARQLFEAMQNVVAHVDEKTGQLNSHHAAAAHLLQRLSEANVTGHSLAERIGESTRTLEQAAESATEQVDRRVQDVSALTAQAEDKARQLCTHNDEAAKLADRLDSGCAPAKEIATQLEQGMDQARQTVAAMTERHEQARKLPDRLRVIMRILKAAKTTQTSVEHTADDARKTLEQLITATENAASRNEALLELNTVAQGLIETGEKNADEADQATRRLESQLSAAQRSAELSDSLIGEFIKQAQALERQVNRLQDEAKHVGERMGELTARPAEIVASAQTQAAELERVCTAVKKVFRGLSSATLEAQKRSTTCQEITNHATVRLAELTSETDRAAATLHEWVEEALRVQSRLEKTLHECPSIRETHPGSTVRRMADVVGSATRIANPSAAELRMLSEPAAEPADQARVTKHATRADEVSRLIDEAKRAASGAKA